jgi:hypothetical protein
VAAKNDFFFLQGECMLLAASQWFTQWQPGCYTFWQRGAPQRWKARKLKLPFQHTHVEASLALPMLFIFYCF